MVHPIHRLTLVEKGMHYSALRLYNALLRHLKKKHTSLETEVLIDVQKPSKLREMSLATATLVKAIIRGLSRENEVSLYTCLSILKIHENELTFETNAVKQGRIVGYDSCQVADKTISSSGVIASVDQYSDVIIVDISPSLS
ncbi:hypothetical protein J6590_045744 [Homalodisca vitripennis]|nr:hypothetical protein J6590_045744 [Homalodisca vitripennis]